MSEDTKPSTFENCTWDPTSPQARIEALEAALTDALKWMEELRASGDAGFWDWDEGDVYTRCLAALDQDTEQET